MIPLLVAIAASFAAGSGQGLLTDMGPAAQHLAVCRYSARDATQEERVAIWKGCLDKAEQYQMDEVTPALRGELAFADAVLDANRAGLKADGPLQERVLVSVIGQSGIVWPEDAVERYVLSYLQTDRGRSRLSEVRDICFKWSNRASLGEEEVRRLDELLRRSSERYGFRFAAFGTSEALRADLVVTGTMRRTEQVPVDPQARVLARVETVIAVDEVLFKSKNLRKQGFLADASAEAASSREAADASALLATEEALQQLLVLALQECLKSVKLEELREDPVEEGM